MKDIFKFALEFEKENRQYYEKAARGTDNKYLKEVFQELAAEEKKHEEIVKALAENREKDEVKSDIIPRAEKVFAAMTENKEETVLPKEQVDIYKEALKLEKKSKNYYKEKAEQSKDEAKKVFLELSREEEKHEKIIKNIIELVNRPNTWLEDPEWYHIEDY